MVKLTEEQEMFCDGHCNWNMHHQDCPRHRARHVEKLLAIKVSLGSIEMEIDVDVTQDDLPQWAERNIRQMVERVVAMDKAINK
jgi:hypothetical protein